MSDGSRVRLDRWLWAARFFKTRALAAAAIGGGKVEVGGARAKRAKLLAVGDRLRIRRGPFEYRVVVRGLSEHRGPPAAAAALYEEDAEGRRLRERLAEQLRGAPSLRDEGKGRKLPPLRENTIRRPRASRGRTMYFQEAVCSTIPKMLWRRRPGRHSASRGARPRTEPHSAVPCHARRSNAWSNTSSSSAMRRSVLTVASAPASAAPSHGSGRTTRRTCAAAPAPRTAPRTGASRGRMPPRSAAARAPRAQSTHRRAAAARSDTSDCEPSGTGRWRPTPAAGPTGPGGPPPGRRSPPGRAPAPRPPRRLAAAPERRPPPAAPA